MDLEMKGVLPSMSPSYVFAAVTMTDESFKKNNVSYFSTMTFNIHKFRQIEVYVIDYLEDKYMVLYSCFQQKASLFGYGYSVKHYAWILAREAELDDDTMIRIGDNMHLLFEFKNKWFQKRGFRYGRCLAMDEMQLKD